MFNELLGLFFNVQKNHIPSSHTHMKYKKSWEKNYIEPKKEKKKQRNAKRSQEKRMKMNVQ